MTMSLLEDFDKLKEDLHKINYNDYKKYINQPIIEEYIFKRNCTYHILLYKQRIEKINCTDPAAIIYIDTGVKILKNLIINNKDNIYEIKTNYSNSIPSHDAISALFSAIGMFVKNETIEKVVSHLPEIGDIGLEILSGEDGLKIEIALTSFAEEAIASKIITLALESM